MPRRASSCAHSTMTRLARLQRDFCWRPAARLRPIAGRSGGKATRASCCTREKRPLPTALPWRSFPARSTTDVEVSVRLKATGGGRVAGLVWKYQDPMNHYAAQLDLVRQEVAVYRVSGGNRIRLEREDDLELDPDAWHSLRVLQEDGQIRVYLGGIRLFGERDRLPRTSSSVGIWVAGDSTVMFDDFRVEDERDDKPPAAGTPPPKP